MAVAALPAASTMTAFLHRVRGLSGAAAPEAEPVAAATATPEPQHASNNASNSNANSNANNSNSNSNNPAAADGNSVWSEDEGMGAMEDAAIPSESELVLLCLDHLRDLRRSHSESRLQRQGIDADFLSMAVWALTRSLTGELLGEHNDCWSDKPVLRDDYHYHHGDTSSNPTLPSLAVMTEEVLDGHDEEVVYDDAHISNAHRMYPLAGLAAAPPIPLGELVVAGMAGLAARTRQSAEAQMIQSPLFASFVQAVTEKGFFDNNANVAANSHSHNNNNNNSTNTLPDELYRQRHRKVVAKFRTKLAAKADAETRSGDLLALAAAEQYQTVRAARNAQDLAHHSDNVPQQQQQNAPELNQTAAPEQQHQHQHEHPADLEEAERLKAVGNTHMQRKEYHNAAQAYTAALKLTPAGPNAHVYYSNRAAALVSLQQFQAAVADSERALALVPEYGKAHARLGLAHFLLGNYRPALEAYTVALKYEPDNKSSRNYLEKAAQRLAEQEQHEGTLPKTPTSYSVVSQWDQRNNNHSHHSSSLHHPTTPSRRSLHSSSALPVTPNAAALSSASESSSSSSHRSASASSLLARAEKAKSQGNALMASREYAQALEAYTQAIALLPDGPHSHVYYSNRAAAYCYLEQYRQAQADSLQSLVLDPTYGKAHARLGLSRFFLHDYQGALEAYEASLRYDPDNAASRSYLLKAQAKLRQQQKQQQQQQG